MRTYYKLLMTSNQRNALLNVQSFFSQHMQMRKRNGSFSISIDDKDVEAFLSISEKNMTKLAEAYMKIAQCCEEIGTITMEDRTTIYFDKDGSLVHDNESLIDMDIQELEDLYNRISDECIVHIKPRYEKVLCDEPRPLMYVVRVVNFSTEDCSETSRYYMDKTSDMNDLDQCDPIDGYTDRHDAYVAMKEEFNSCMQDAFFDESLLHGHNISCNPDEDGINVYIDGLLRCRFSIEAI